MATSRSGSNSTTWAGNPWPFWTTIGPLVTLATTCALVSTCCGEITKPEPSSCREQCDDVPTILTMLLLARDRPAECSTLEFGGGTLSAPSSPSAPNTCV